MPTSSILMKAALLKSYGNTDQFTLADVPRPSAGVGEVLIRIAASALNPFDLILRQGLMAQYIPLPLPAILGGDAAGTIVAIGGDVTGLSIGDRVVADFSANGKGAHAEFGVVPASSVARLPANLSFEQGAALVKAGLTGRQTVDALDVGPGDRVLVSGALGAVGRAAIQYIKEIGATPVAGVRTGRLDEARNLVGETLDMSILPAAPTFDFAINTAASSTVNLIAHVRNGGIIASIVPLPETINANGRVRILELYHRTDAATLDAVLQAASRGDLGIPVAQVLPLAQIAAAHQKLAEGVQGKIVLTH